MERTSSGPMYLEAPSGSDREANGTGAADVSRRMVADRLSAALASGNLEHLELARQAFVERSRAEPCAGAERQPAKATEQLTAPTTSACVKKKRLWVLGY